MRRYAISVLVVLVAAAAAAIARPGEDGGGASAAREPGRVTRVVDGDTIIVGDERVRLIGVDTPETKKPGTPVQCFGKKATAFTKRLVEHRKVTLERDAEERDRYGRLLAYVRR